ncbi:MAG: AsmA family protein [Cyclobacteriaceae bacterium]|nr:AsmA family protein [Cyclobacteriaceae bacterium]
MKILKKVLIGLFVLLVLIVAAAFILPIVFKDDIKAAIDKEIAKNINADVLFDVDKFGLTVFKNFPNITAEVKDLGVFNRAPFEGVPLFVVDEVDVEINLKDILFGDQLRLKGISLFNPQITIKVLKDGRANYDITFPAADSVSSSSPEESGSFSFGIDHWEITGGQLFYDDQSLAFFTSLKGLNHSGKGDFNEKEFDLTTRTQIDSLTVAYEGMEYLSNKRTQLDAVIGISENYTRYTFKDNTTKLNDFAMSAEGWFKMNEDNYEMDLAFTSPENSFKSLLSLVPGIYTQDFGTIETKGDLSFSGFAKGIYSETKMPAFNMVLNVSDAMFKYPDLPTAISNIAMDLSIDNKTGIIENTVVDLKKLHLDFGTNPVDARLLIENLKDYRMNGNLKASLNLNELGQMFPMEGLEMKGKFSINASAKGVYDSLKKIIPAIDATMALNNGFVKSSEFPLPLEDLHFSTSINNTSGNMAETIIAVKDFSMLMDGEKFTADLILQNLNDYTWDAKVNGGVDLEKITRIFPLEGMTLAGKVKANIQTKGKYSDLEASRYDRLPTSGSASLKDFKYSASDLPYIVTMSQAEAAFDPQKIELKNTTGTIGKSDFTLTGALNNYIGYLFGSNETIRGNLTFHSTLLDLNEFMTETEEATTPTTDTSSLGVLEVPKNINFLLHANVKTTRLMDYTITNALGDVIVKDGIANLSGIKFNLLGGTFTVNGTYNTQNLEHPLYDMALKIESLSIQQAASSFSIIQTYAPIAGLVNGSFGTDFQISGELGQDMTPRMNTVNAAGLVKIAQAALTQSKLISSVTSLTKLDDADNVTLKDVLMSATIREGRLSVKPFDVKFGNYVTNVSGSTGLDGSIAYQLKMNVPAGKLGSQMQGFINQYAGTTNPTSEIPVTIGLGGTYNDPKPTLLMQEQKQQVKEAATAVAEEKGKQVAQDVLAGKKPEEAINNLFKKDTTKAAVPADSTKTDLKQETQKALENKLQNLLKKKKNN